MEVAIKRHCEHHELQWFLKEVMLMAAIQNPHLVMLLGCCFKGNDHILVYELPPMDVSVKPCLVDIHPFVCRVDSHILCFAT
jgi:hypothetical protein